MTPRHDARSESGAPISPDPAAPAEQAPPEQAAPAAPAAPAEQAAPEQPTPQQPAPVEQATPAAAAAPEQAAPPEGIKQCCAAAYGHDVVSLLLGDSYHPGGQALTDELAAALGLRPGQRVLDVAAGPGKSARRLAAQRGVHVDGIDLGEQAVDTARREAEQAGLSGSVRFHRGDAERIPLPEAAFDAVICECAFCTFPDKPTAAAEFARVLAPGGQVGITDITVGPDGLPAELTGLGGWIACVADARPLEDYIALLAAAGLHTVTTRRHDHAVRSMIDAIEARLKLLRMTAPARLAEAGIEVDTALHYTGRAARAARDGALGYALIVARKLRE